MRAPSDGLDATTWNGVRDTSLLLDAEKKAVSKTISKRARAAEKAEQAAAVVRERVRKRQARATIAAAAEERRRDYAAKGAVKRQQAEQQRLHIAHEQATRVIPEGVTPMGILHIVDTQVLSLTTDINDKFNPTKTIHISNKHPRFSEFAVLLRKPAVKQRARRR